MQYHRITTTDDPALTFIRKLYENAFPPQERREWFSLLSILPSEEDMHLDLIYTDDGHIGFIIWWKIGDYSFIEHFAIDAELRGKSYGGAVISYYRTLLPGTIILEVEHPEDADSIRRISFYERLGYHALVVAYLQPSYTDPDAAFPLMLMSNPFIDDSTALRLAEEIKNKVYHPFVG